MIEARGPAKTPLQDLARGDFIEAGMEQELGLAVNIVVESVCFEHQFHQSLVVFQRVPKLCVLGYSVVPFQHHCQEAHPYTVQ